MGLLLYKPQFAIPLIGLFILSGRLRIAFFSVVTGCLIIAVGLFFTGVQPYEQWLIFLKWFVPTDANVNGHNAISWIGFLDAVFGTENRMVFILVSHTASQQFSSFLMCGLSAGPNLILMPRWVLLLSL